MSPLFFLLGKLFAKFVRIKKFDAFFFFHSVDVGGAEKVHLDILDGLDLHPSKVRIVITLFDNENRWLYKFERFGSIVILANAIKNINNFYYYLGYYSTLINRSKPLFVFGSVSYFYYRLVPFIQNKIRKFDLTHNLMLENQKGVEHSSLPVNDLFDLRICSHEVVKNGLAKIINNTYSGKTDHLIAFSNGVFVPFLTTKKSEHYDELICLFIGRNSPEKRIDLLDELIHDTLECTSKVRFILVGDNFDTLKSSNLPQVEVVGICTEDHELFKLYEKSHVILLTSDREGTPMSILEAMAFGCVPIVTKVGALASIVTSDIGYCVEKSNSTVKEMRDCILNLLNDQSRFQKLSNNAHKLVAEEYNKATMQALYRRNLLLE